jgi:hypothetical protein
VIWAASVSGRQGYSSHEAQTTCKEMWRKLNAYTTVGAQEEEGGAQDCNDR